MVSAAEKLKVSFSLIAAVTIDYSVVVGKDNDLRESLKDSMVTIWLTFHVS